MTAAIVVEGLERSFGETKALAGLDMVVREGTVLGLLGPNGAGKTTAVRILATLLHADAGRASVLGYDVATHPEEVRGVIGLTGQYAAVDENLTGFENLDVIGRLAQLSNEDAKTRAGELLEQFNLTDAGGRPARTYSGGMRRRLDLAASLVAKPAVLFLDEPTTGLDPQSRLALWETIRELRRSGTTTLLTTQYLDEADQLADEILVIDHGKVVASGTSDDLKHQLGGDVLEIRLADPTEMGRAIELLPHFEHRVDDEKDLLHATVLDGQYVLADTVRRLDDAGIRITDIGRRMPSLDEVFLTLTGRKAEEELPTDESEEIGRRRGRRRERSTR